MAVLTGAQRALRNVLLRVQALAALGMTAFAALTLLALGARAVAAAPASDEPDKEYKLKAAFVLNFVRFTDWPTNVLTSTNQALVIGVLGRDPFGQNLDEIVAGKTVGHRSVHVKRVGNAAEALTCHAVFISDSEKANLPSILRELEGQPVLTVGDCEGFVQAGGIIELKRRQDMLRFSINLSAAEDAKLKISSKLLKLAEIYRDKRN